MSKWAKIVLAIAVIAVVNFTYATLVAPLIDSLLGPGHGFAIIPWLLAFSISIAYGVISYRMTQNEFGVRELLGLLAHITLGWLKHWRLLVAVVLISLGIAIVASSSRVWTYSQVTGYRYILYKDYGYALGGFGIQQRGLEVVTGVDFAAQRVQTEHIKFVTGISYTSLTQLLADAQLIEFPILTHYQIWYLDAGLMVVGLGLVAAGLIFGMYHAVLANNKLLESCGEHTARYYTNYIRMCGYKVPDGYEEALKEYYRTGNISRLRRFTQ